jgi:hypothetical protein
LLNNMTNSPFVPKSRNGHRPTITRPLIRRPPQFVAQADTVAAISGPPAMQKNVSVVFLDQAKKPVPEDTPATAIGFRFEKQSKDQVRVTMICGG